MTVRRRTRGVLVLGVVGLALAFGAGVLLLPSHAFRGPFSRFDENARARLCGVHVRQDGSQYCASELAAKNSSAMHRCENDKSAVLVHYADETGQESDTLDICCECGHVQARDDTHAVSRRVYRGMEQLVVEAVAE